MRTRHLSFQLEETISGTFLLQGWLGGILAGFVYTVAMGLWDRNFKFPDLLITGAFLTIFTSMLGVIKAALMWAPYRLTKIQPRAVTRVALASIATGVFALSIALLVGTRRPNDLIAWTIILVLGGLPTAILIGSSIKPWDLFTFGSIAGERRRSVLGTLGTLPLRFVSLLVFALWTVYAACWVSDAELWSYEHVLWFLLPTAYLLFCAYVTFSSPPKAILFVTGLGANVPVAYVGLFAYLIYAKFSDSGESAFYVFTICFSLVIAWVVFLIARLSVRTDTAANPLSILPNVQFTHGNNLDHHCLGSRFIDWQERHAQ